jgi:hypothetical protein
MSSGNPSDEAHVDDLVAVRSAHSSWFGDLDPSVEEQVRVGAMRSPDSSEVDDHLWRP